MNAHSCGPRPGEVVIQVPDAEALSVRVCVSPMATLLTTIFEALLDLPRGAPDPWYRQVRERAARHAPALASIYRTPARTFPEFVAPNPIASRATIEQELAALRATDPDQIRDEVALEFGAHPPQAYRPFVSTPSEAVNDLADRLEAVWTVALAPLWVTIESIIEREVLTLAAALVSEGAPALLARLHPRIVFDGARLCWSSQAEGREVALADGRLVVVPMVAGPDALMSTNRSEVGSIIAYAAPGSAALWEVADTRTSAALARLLGETRSRTMLAAATAATTSDVALQLNISPNLASHHLKALEGMGLVHGTRFGRRVYYRLTTRGRQVRDAFCTPADDETAARGR